MSEQTDTILDGYEDVVRQYREQVAVLKAERDAARAENSALRGSLKRALLAGNHLAVYLGRLSDGWHLWTYDQAQVRLGGTGDYEVFCAWRCLMNVANEYEPGDRLTTGFPALTHDEAFPQETIDALRAEVAALRAVVEAARALIESRGGSVFTLVDARRELVAALAALDQRNDTFLPEKRAHSEEGET